MPRPTNPIPSYRLHRPTGQAITTVRSADGSRKDIYLGRYNSPESKQEYTRIISELKANGSAPTTFSRSADLTVNELILQFTRHAERYYRNDDGTPSRELKEYRHSLIELRELYGHTIVREFGPLAIKAIREVMMSGKRSRKVRLKNPKTGRHTYALRSMAIGGLSRGVINQRISRIKRMFRWGVENELVPPHVYQGLCAVSGLRRGRCDAREMAPIPPADLTDVEATIVVLPASAAAMVRVHLLTGCRPGEICSMTPAEIDRTGPIWFYHPSRHKSAWRGKTRSIAIGPQAQAILSPLLARRSVNEPVFSPAEVRQERFAALRTRRKTKVQPSQLDRSKPRQQRQRHIPRAFTVDSYAAMIRLAVKRANANRVKIWADCGPNLPEVRRWHPNQLRHAHATEVRRRFGLEAAQVALGHSRADVTQVYAERDLTLAARVAAEVG